MGARKEEMEGECSQNQTELHYYSIVEEDNRAQYYPVYAYSHPLFAEGMRIYSDSKVSDF